MKIKQDLKWKHNYENDQGPTLVTFNISLDIWTGNAASVTVQQQLQNYISDLNRLELYHKSKLIVNNNLYIYLNIILTGRFKD